MCEHCDRIERLYGAGTVAAVAVRNHMHPKTPEQRVAYDDAAWNLAQYLAACEERNHSDG